MKILITGSSGLIGSALAESLVGDGHRVIRLLRKNRTAGFPSWDPDRGVIDLADTNDIAAVVHLAGDSIADGRWNEHKKDRILNSRVRGTRLLAETFAASDHKPRVIVSASAVGLYGDQGTKIVDEASEPGTGFLANVCEQWELATAPASGAGIRVANVRLGVVLSPAGGALSNMLLPFKMGLGGVIGSGAQYMSWVSIDDAVGAMQHVIKNDSLRGPVNLVSPTAVTNREFTATLGRVLHRPTILPMPAFAARIAFGEMANELLLASTRVFPQQLMDTDYKFRHPELREALKDLLRKRDNI